MPSLESCVAFLGLPSQTDQLSPFFSAVDVACFYWVRLQLVYFDNGFNVCLDKWHVLWIKLQVFYVCVCEIANCYNNVRVKV